MRVLLISLPIVLLTGCATPEARLRVGLQDAGLSKPQSACMAERMVDKLSLGQLIKLSSLKKINGPDVREMTAKQFLRNVRALEDPEIVSVSTRAALGCAITG